MNSGAAEAGQSRLARHSLFNLLGQGSPFLAAIFAIPLLIRGLGTDRFGVLTLSWVVIGYFSLFDLGLGRALTQLVASKSGERDHAVAPPVAWMGLAMMAVLGLVGTLVSFLVSPWLVHSVLKVPAELRGETLQAFYLLGLAIPIVVVTAGLVGILTAFHRFGLVNAIRAPSGIYVLVAPLLVLPWSQSLVAVMGVLVLGRLATGVIYLRACLRHLPPPGTIRSVPAADVRSLFRFGAWMTVTNVISPLLVSLDRLFIGATVSVTAVAWYATPYEMITKVLIVPGAILGVLFPAFASTYQTNHARLLHLFTRGTAYIVLLLFPVTLVVVAFAHEGLRLWLGTEFAQHGAPVLQWLAVGVFVNAIAQVCFTLILGVGRPDLTAKLHLVELPLYVPLLWFAIQRYGIVGAAIAWTARVTVDAALLVWMSRRFLRDGLPLLRRMTLGLVTALIALSLPVLIEQLAARATLVVVLLAAFISVAWFVVLEPGERMSIRRWVARPAGA